MCHTQPESKSALIAIIIEQKNIFFVSMKNFQVRKGKIQTNVCELREKMSMIYYSIASIQIRSNFHLKITQFIVHGSVVA